RVQQDRPRLEVKECTVSHADDLRASGRVRVTVHGVVEIAQAASTATEDHPTVDIFVDGQQVSEDNVSVENRANASSAEALYGFSCVVDVPSVPERSDKDKVEAKIARDMIMVMVVARSVQRGRPSGWLALLE
ncbi:MAG: hypothetical protein ACRERD_33010, partial [Candidatus Binatia bacterium]